jgi:hypothetical protein
LIQPAKSSYDVNALKIGLAPSGLTTGTISPKIFQHELAFTAVERGTATQTEYLVIVGWSGFDAHDFILRITVRALEWGRVRYGGTISEKGSN